MGERTDRCSITSVAKAGSNHRVGGPSSGGRDGRAEAARLRSAEIETETGLDYCRRKRLGR